MHVPRFQVLQQWKKKNPKETFQDLVDVFHQARRMDLVEITCKVAGEAIEQDKRTAHVAHHPTQLSKLWEAMDFAFSPAAGLVIA